METPKIEKKQFSPGEIKWADIVSLQSLSFQKYAQEFLGFLNGLKRALKKINASTRKCHLQRESKIALLVVTEVVGERGWHVDLPHQRLASQGRVPVNGLIHFNCHQIEN